MFMYYTYYILDPANYTWAPEMRLRNRRYGPGVCLNGG